MWSGGVVGLKSILGVKNRTRALEIMDRLQELGYIEYSLDTATKKQSYYIKDWVVKCSGAECMDGAVYTTEGYGFLCLPRSITQRLAEQNHTFEESDAWLDLWCHTTWQDPRNAFSFFAPAVQYGSYGAALTLETLGQRWNWEKTKVWRFFKKHGDAFALYRLPGAYGCLVFNKLYPAGTEVSLPSYAEIERIIGQIRISAGNTHIAGTDNLRLNKMILWYSRSIAAQPELQSGETAQQGRVALSAPIIRAYLSLCWNCKNCSYDCGRLSSTSPAVTANHIRGPCADATTKKQRRIPMSKHQDSANKALYEPAGEPAFGPVLCLYQPLDQTRHFGRPRDRQRPDPAGAEGEKRNMYHNTLLLLQHYRNIVWALECFPATVAEELDHPLGDLDALLDRMDLEFGMNNRKLESRMESVRKSRLLLDRVNEALSVLKRKPENGAKMYELIYLTYIAPDKLSHTDLLYRLDISSRHYYRLRQQAFTILSIRLWSAPAGEVDSWLEVLTLLESI